MLVVTVRFELSENGFEGFRSAILKNAAASIRQEAGCHCFDVAFSDDRRRCFLYELYTNQAAFAEHQETAHFREFSRMSAPYVEDKRLETYRIEPNPLLKNGEI